VWSGIKGHLPDRRMHPARKRLREALFRAKIPVITWDLMVSEIDTGWGMYYDVMVQYSKDKIGVILVVPRQKKYVGLSVHGLIKRKEFALKCGWAFTDIYKDANIIQVQHALEYWTLTGIPFHYPNWRKNMEKRRTHE
jgi:hypothetical protein